MPTHSSAYCACHTPRCRAKPTSTSSLLSISCKLPLSLAQDAHPARPGLAGHSPSSTCLLTVFYAPLNAVNTSSRTLYLPLHSLLSLSLSVLASPLPFAVLFAIFKVINHKTARGYFIIITSGSEASFSVRQRFRRRGRGQEEKRGDSISILFNRKMTLSIFFALSVVFVVVPPRPCCFFPSFGFGFLL